MVACSQCGTLNRPEARFCSHCRAKLTRFCPACGHENRLSSQFCSRCGVEQVRICPNCKSANRPGARFCQRCRAQLDAASPSRQQVVSAPAWQPVAPVMPARQPSLASPAQLPHAPGTIPPGTLLNGRYLIQSKIAQGGMGAVYRAADTQQGNQTRAVKEMTVSESDPADQAAALTHFQREGQLLARLRHANLPQVVDIFVEGGHQFMAMEFVEGETLGALLESKAGQPLPEKEVLGWAGQLCDVLEYLHTQPRPIIYRDMKPDNVMIERDTGRLKLIDFGIVRFYKSGKSKDTTALGTKGYAAPEQFGAQTDERSDIYSLAAMLHHLLTGRDPRKGKMFDFPPVRTLAPRVSADVEAALVEALKPKREERPQTIAEFRQLLGLQPGQTQPKAASAAPAPASPQQPASIPPNPSSAPAVVSPGTIDFGAVQLGARATRRLTVHSLPGMTGSVNTQQTWLQVSPSYLKGASTDIDVRLDTSTMQLTRLSWRIPPIARLYWERLWPLVQQYWWFFLVGALAGLAWQPAWLLTALPFIGLALAAVVQALLWWARLHAAWLVKAATSCTGRIDVDTGGMTQTVAVAALVTPDPVETRWRWAAVAGLLAAELFAAVMIVATVASG